MLRIEIFPINSNDTSDKQLLDTYEIILAELKMNQYSIIEVGWNIRNGKEKRYLEIKK